MLIKVGEKFGNVNATHAEYAKMINRWQKMEDVTSDEQTIHDAGEIYLPRLPKMDDDEYAAYVARGSFPMFTKHTLNNFVGMAMRKDVMTSGVPDILLDNVDGTGLDLTEYVKKLVRQFLTYGRIGTFVEYADASARPKLLQYPAQVIPIWDTRIVNDVEVLSMVVLKEMVKGNADPFSQQTEYQFRVLMLDEEQNFYYQAVIDKQGYVKKVVTPKKRHRSLDFIPFIIHGGWEVSFPPLLQIADENLHYYRLDAEYKHGLHYVSLPTPWTEGIEDPKDRPRTLGCSEIWHLPEGAKCGMLEFSGAGLGEFTSAKDENNERIVTLSSRILAPPRNLNETATAAAIRNAGDTASLAEVIGMLSREVTKAMTWARDWLQESTEELTVTINNDFIPTILSGSDVASYVASYLKGGMSFYTLFHVLKRGEIQEGDREIGAEIAEIRKEVLERQTDEAKLAEMLGNVQAKIDAKAVENVSGQTPKDKSDHIQPGRDGEQVNKGQMKEN